MTTDDRDTRKTDDLRGLIADLHALGTIAAPPSVHTGVLVGAGLAAAGWPIETPLGPMFIAAGADGVTLLDAAADFAVFARAHQDRVGRPVVLVTNPPSALDRAVRAQLAGDARAKPAVDLRRLSPFEQAVLGKAREIPRGEVRPYGWLAREIGRPRAVRAVGSALARNPVPLLIPCHRVVRGDGEIGNYIFGSERKRRLLRAEGVPVAEGPTAAIETGLTGSDTTHIFCYPTCRHARRTTSQHRVAFASPAVAVAAGYRPCRVCRPVIR